MKLAVIISALVLSFSSHGGEIKSTPVQNFDVQKYAGKWYEIARTQNRFEKGCSNVSANYLLNKDGTLKVINKCFVNGKEKTAKGRAKFVGKSTVGKLEVTFFWPFYGDYNVVYLDGGYQNAIVDGGSDEYLWILSRQKNLDAKTLNFLLEKAKTNGFDVSKLIYVKHD